MQLLEEWANPTTRSAAYLQGTTGVIKSLVNNVYYYQDKLGSTSHVANSSGHLLESFHYDLSGNPTETSAYGVVDLYAGERWIGQLGLYDLRNRFMSPELGRFLQADPIGQQIAGAKLSAQQKAFYPAGQAPEAFASTELNLYRYCHNDPVNKTDPDGLYGRGDGWTEKQWKMFDAAQKAAATGLEKASAKMDPKVFENVFGKGSATPGNMAKVQKIMQSMAAALRDDGSKGFMAHATRDWRINAMRGNLPQDTLAHTKINSTTIFANVDHGRYSNPSSLSWAAGHEAGHNFGLRDEAYKHQTQMYKALTSSQALQNADSFMDFATR